MNDLKRTTGIEWTQHTWNPFIGCSVHSKGCENCYAMRMAHRVESFGTPHYKGVTKKTSKGNIWTGKINRASERQFKKPLSIKKKSLIFVNSMSDFFHANAKIKDMLDAIEIMRETEHYYQVLTKRPENIQPFLNKTGITLPDNMWIGTSVESEKVAHRIKTLKQVDAAVKFISFEPLIDDCGKMDLSGIDWAISGGESGFHNRPLDYDWVLNIQAMADKYSVNHFFKQWGDWKNNPLINEYDGLHGKEFIAEADPIGKGGSMLDGEYYKEMPAAYH